MNLPLISSISGRLFARAVFVLATLVAFLGGMSSNAYAQAWPSAY